jgi:hypothetical protein
MMLETEKRLLHYVFSVGRVPKEQACQTHQPVSVLIEHSSH